MPTNMFSGEGFFMAGQTPNSGMVLCESTDVGLVATGSTAAGALPLVSTVNIFATVGTTTGARLPAIDALGAAIVVLNGGASVLTVYPPTGGVVNGGTVNAADAGTIAAVSSGVPGKATYRNLGGTPAAYVRA